VYSLWIEGAIILVGVFSPTPDFFSESKFTDELFPVNIRTYCSKNFMNKKFETASDVSLVSNGKSYA
jgi:hypothetical protein